MSICNSESNASPLPVNKIFILAIFIIFKCYQTFKWPIRLRTTFAPTALYIFGGTCLWFVVSDRTTYHALEDDMLPDVDIPAFCAILSIPSRLVLRLPLARGLRVSRQAGEPRPCSRAGLPLSTSACSTTQYLVQVFEMIITTLMLTTSHIR